MAPFSWPKTWVTDSSNLVFVAVATPPFRKSGLPQIWARVSSAFPTVGSVHLISCLASLS